MAERTRAVGEHGLVPTWLADRFAEIEMKDMRVTEVRVRSFPEEFFRHAGGYVRGRKHVWNARLVEDRTMRQGVVKLSYEKVVEERPPPRVRSYSRKRCYACGQTVPA